LDPKSRQKLIPAFVLILAMYRKYKNSAYNWPLKQPRNCPAESKKSPNMACLIQLEFPFNQPQLIITVTSKQPNLVSLSTRQGVRSGLRVK